MSNDTNTSENEINEETNVLKSNLKDDAFLNAFHYNIESAITEKVNSTLRIQIVETKQNKNEAILQNNQLKLREMKDRINYFNHMLEEEHKHCPEIERELHNTGLMINMLKEHFLKLESQYKTTLASKSKFQNDLESDQENHNLKEKKLVNDSKVINDERNSTVKINMNNNKEFENSILKYENDIEVIQSNAIKLKENIKNNEITIESLNKKLLFAKNVELEKVNEKEFLENRISNIDLKELESRKNALEIQQEKIFENMKKSFIQLKANEETLDSTRVELQAQIEEEIAKTLDLEKTFKELEQLSNKIQEKNSELQNQFTKIEYENTINYNNHNQECENINFQIIELDKKICEYVTADWTTMEKLESSELVESSINEENLKMMLSTLQEKLLVRKQELVANKHNYNVLSNKFDNLTEPLNNDETQNLTSKIEFLERKQQLVEKLEYATQEINKKQIELENIMSKLQDKIKECEEKRQFFTEMQEYNETVLQKKKVQIQSVSKSVQDENTVQETFINRCKMKEEMLIQLNSKKQQLVSKKLELSKKCQANRPGILKVPKKIQPTVDRRVSFKQDLKWESSESSVEVTNSQTGTAEELWEEMNRSQHSPPEKLNAP